MTRCPNGHKAFDTELWPAGCPDCMPVDPRPRYGATGKDRTVVEGQAASAVPKTGNSGTVIMRGAGSQRLVGWLVVLAGPQRNTDFRLVEGDNRIGRSADSEVRLQDTNVSTAHASINYEDGSFEIIDLRSSNGTYLNDSPKKVIRETLKHGDVVRVGDTSLKFVRYE
jgi:pSer/pThr/pTyr-binding forkhead associated (FHA) protein